ncbi:MAG: hypothetical protein VX498_09780 [Myxococcota bacterium]|nr:hypothetical protein [Myxococcota bacterium]
MSDSTSFRILLRRLLPPVIVVVILLGGVRLWLGAGEQGTGERGARGDGPPGAGPDEIGFRPEPGSYLRHIQAAGVAAQRVPIEISRRGSDGYRLNQPYHPPEPILEEIPQVLSPHLGRIRLRIDIGSSGHVVDVTGPDDYFERLDQKQSGLSDPIRALLLEEQVDAALSWQIPPIVSQPAVPGRTWTHEVRRAGFSGGSPWSGVLRYTMGETANCGPASPDEDCIPVTIDTESGEGGERLFGTLWVGTSSGLQWQAELTRADGGQRRTVTMRLERK